MFGSRGAGLGRVATPGYDLAPQQSRSLEEDMKMSVVGLFVGILLAIAAAVAGWWAFLLAVVLGIVGLVVGAMLDGDLDISGLLRGRGHG